LEPSFQGRDARIGECRHIRGAEVMTLLEARLVVAGATAGAKAVLRKSKRRAGKRNERGCGDHWPQHGNPPAILHLPKIDGAAAYGAS
jgi:hypothetical protein